jgi:putative nucleotidyltransferase with HDIG domain
MTLDSKKLRTKSIVSTLNSFPTLPAVVTRVIEITADPESSIDDLMKVISMDQSLTASVLKNANSAFYGVARNVGSLKEALTVLGFAEIQKIVLSKAVFESFKHLSGDESFEFKKFWEHSFYCGLTAKIIARETATMHNEMFVAGIIHDIGKLILYLALKTEYLYILNYSLENDVDIHIVENKVLGVNHSKIGMDLLRRWMFPEKLIMAVGYHHSPMESTKEKKIPVIICLADLLARLLTKRSDGLPLKNIEQKLESVEVFEMAAKIDLEWSMDKKDELIEKVEILKEEEIEILNLFLS